jgi:hypothetical protein
MSNRADLERGPTTNSCLFMHSLVDLDALPVRTTTLSEQSPNLRLSDLHLPPPITSPKIFGQFVAFS